MTKKRFINGGEECIEDQFLIDTFNYKNYWVSYGLDDIVELLNELHEGIQDLTTKKEDIEYELLHLKEKYEALLEKSEELKQQNDFLKTQFDRVCIENEEMGDKLKQIGRIL